MEQGPQAKAQQWEVPPCAENVSLVLREGGPRNPG